MLLIDADMPTVHVVILGAYISEEATMSRQPLYAFIAYLETIDSYLAPSHLLEVRMSI